MQVLFLSWKFWWHTHLYDPSIFIHWWEHVPNTKHSLRSRKEELKIVSSYPQLVLSFFPHFNKEKFILCASTSYSYVFHCLFKLLHCSVIFSGHNHFFPQYFHYNDSSIVHCLLIHLTFWNIHSLVFSLTQIDICWCFWLPTSIHLYMSYAILLSYNTHAHFI